MSAPDAGYRRRVQAANVGFWLASRASRNRTLLDRLARLVLRRMIQPVSGQDELVLANPEYDPAELERYERGEIADAVARPARKS